MTDLLHAALAATLLYAVVAGGLTTLAHIALQRRAGTGSVMRFGGPNTVLLLVGPTVVAALWVGSALLHELEPGRTLAECCAPLAAEIGMGEFLMLCAAAAMAVGGAVVGWDVFRSHRAVDDLDGSRACAQRIRGVCERSAVLAPFESLIRVVEGLGLAAATRGVLRPRIEVDHTLLSHIDDQALEAILLHEAGHLRHGDPARLVACAVALGLNPLGYFLRPALNQWRFARELQCDMAAVQEGADPLALAGGIVTAARQTRGHSACCAAAADSSPAELRARVELLSAYAYQTPPIGLPERVSFVAVALTSAALLTLPHLLPTFSLHCVVENAVAALL